MINSYCHLTFFIAYIVSFLTIWIWASFEDWPYHGWFHYLRGIGTFFGVVGYLFISFSLLLSSRWKTLENWIGGLDQLYKWHHQVGMWGFVFTLLHPLILAIRWIPQHWDKFITYIFPIHEKLSVNLGSYSLLLMLVLVFITYLRSIAYDKWKLSHKFMNVVFILATLHIILLERRFSSSHISYFLLFIPMGLGFFGIVYKQIVSDFIVKHPLFEVIKTQIINDSIIEIFIKSKENKLFFIPGQYVFCSFEADKLTRESHPFTLCGSPDDPILSILVKIRGDFTRSIYQHVKSGDLLRLERPYGRFDYTKAGPSQIWIAGGICYLAIFFTDINTSRSHLLKQGKQEWLDQLPKESGLDCIILVANQLSAHFCFHDTPRLWISLLCYGSYQSRSYRCICCNKCFESGFS